MKKIVFATNNEHKLVEIKEILGNEYEIISLQELGCTEEIPETADTLEGNALQKARYIHDKFRVNCFADDTGLEVEALNGAPGVYSARYAGEAKDANLNMQKLLMELDGVENRKARFCTVIALILDEKEYLFEGEVQGEILKAKKGAQGFGYDPVFQPTGYSNSFAELDSSEKNAISHRGNAVKKLAAFFEQLK